MIRKMTIRLQNVLIMIMNNIVVECLRMCYNLKRAIVLQGVLTSFK